jgi:hypothetical protein
MRERESIAADFKLRHYRRLLRTGAANLSAPGLTRQDNDLIVIENAEAAVAFKRAFDARFASGDALSAGTK